MQFLLSLSLLLSNSTKEALEALYYEPESVAKCVYYMKAYESGSHFNYRGVNSTWLPPSLTDLPVIICLHGDDSSPNLFIPLIDILKQDPHSARLPIFAPQFTYKDKSSPYELISYMKEMKARYDRIKKPLKVIFIGHSMGGITATHFTYYSAQALGIQILSMIGVSSRLKYDSSQAGLKEMLEDIDRALFQEKQTTPYYAIYGDHDWLVPLYELSGPDEDKTFIASGKSHISTLFDESSLEYIRKAVIKNLK